MESDRVYTDTDRHRHTQTHTDTSCAHTHMHKPSLLQHVAESDSVHVLRVRALVCVRFLRAAVGGAATPHRGHLRREGKAGPGAPHAGPNPRTPSSCCKSRALQPRHCKTRTQEPRAAPSARSTLTLQSPYIPTARCRT
eukprot:2087771-Rhodomonas_salina.1